MDTEMMPTLSKHVAKPQPAIRHTVATAMTTATALHFQGWNAALELTASPSLHRPATVLSLTKTRMESAMASTSALA